MNLFHGVIVSVKRKSKTRLLMFQIFWVSLTLREVLVLIILARHFLTKSLNYSNKEAPMTEKPSRKKKRFFYEKHFTDADICKIQINGP